MKFSNVAGPGIVALAVLALVASGCATLSPAGDGIVMLGEHGKDKRVTPEEIDAMCGVDLPYYIQVGDVVNLDFKLQNMRADEVAWDYRIEVGDSMELRLLPGQIEPGQYKLEVGDVIGISFLENWPLNVTRTVRPDGMISVPEVGDVPARGRTPLEVRADLTDGYLASGIVEDARITVNVDFVNLDRYEEMSRDIVVRPDGAVRLPGINTDMRLAGLTVAEATDLVEKEAAKVMMNPPRASLIIFPAVETNALAGMSGAVQVRPDGRISVARLGEMQAAGYSVDELSHTLQQSCEGIIHNPMEASVDVLKATGSRLYIGGEVKAPGVYPLEGAPTALQAVMTANGFNDRSRLNNVIVLRRNPSGKPFVFKTNLRVAITQGHTENDIMLRPFDIVYVPKKTISKLNLFVEQYIDRLVPFDNSLGVNAQYYMNSQKVNSKAESFNFNTGVTGLTSVLGM